ncbi:MAG: hypothetical protein LAO03_18020 [Acidobacteriia bacterium]|nr:hypothetical protein [Terriglobia bacterium]
MTNAGEPSAVSKLPLGLVLIIVCCFVRALLSLWFVGQMVRYLTAGSIGIYQYMFTSLVEAVVWVVLGVGLRRLAARARVAAMVFCGIILAWSSYLFLSAMLHQTIQHWNFPLFAFNVVTDFAIIAYLAQGSVKVLFQPKAPPTS